MNETWEDLLSDPILYGTLLYGDDMYGSTTWDIETTTTVTWTEEEA
jgi:hypothetical protein